MIVVGAPTPNAFPTMVVVGADKDKDNNSNNNDNNTNTHTSVAILAQVPVVRLWFISTPCCALMTCLTQPHVVTDIASAFEWNKHYSALFLAALWPGQRLISPA